MPEAGKGAWLIQETPGAAAEAIPGVWMSQPITAAAETGLGGGFIRFDRDADLGTWRLTYDEVLYVIEGKMTVELVDPAGEELSIEAGGSALLGDGVTVRYRGVAGTRALYVITPREARPVPAAA